MDGAVFVPHGDGDSAGEQDACQAEHGEWVEFTCADEIADSVGERQADGDRHGNMWAQMPELFIAIFS